MRLSILATHPIQYQAPVFRHIAGMPEVNLQVYFGHRPTREEQGWGFEKPFEWAEDPASGYPFRWLKNDAHQPGLDHFAGISNPEIEDILKQDRPDAVIIPGWIHRCCIQAIRAANRLRIPIFLRGDSQLDPGHSNVRKLIFRTSRSGYVRKARCCLAYGARSEEYFRFLGSTRVVKVPHCIETLRFRQRSASVSKEEARRKFQLPEAGKVVLFAGKFIPKKRLEWFFERLGKMASPNLRIMMVGEGDGKAELQKIASRFQLSVRWAGFLDQPEMPAAYRAADLLVLPSDYGETWGLVVNEAMTCGCPALISDACGCAPEMIIPGKTGELFAFDNASECEQKLSSLLSPQFDLGKMGIVAQEHAIQFTPQRTATGLVDAIRNELSGRKT